LAGIVGGGGVKDNRITMGDAEPELGAMYGYMSTKHAVVAISETMAGDLSGSRIGVSVLCPSHHENTNIYENSARFRPESAEDLYPTLKRALEVDGPAVVDVPIDYAENVRLTERLGALAGMA